MNWDLSIFYDSFQSTELQADLKTLDDYISKLNNFEAKFDNNQEHLEEFLKLTIDYTNLVIKISAFGQLTLATDTSNTDALNLMSDVSKKLTQLAALKVKADKWIASFESFDTEFLQKHKFYLEEIKKNSAYYLAPEIEEILSKVNQDGLHAFERQHGLLTSSLDVDYKGDVITLSEIRNLAYDKDPEVRKSAYEAELASYKKIEKPIAITLNSIKGYVNTITKLKGYDSALGKTLVDSRVNKETLDAMYEAIDEVLPTFRKYMRRKAEMLGHMNGLPFYEMFAPIGDEDQQFSVEEAQKMVLENFGSFSPDMKAMAQRSFDENWIDYAPKKGKRGGAFCRNLHPNKQSRILLNFTGSFDNVLTMAHELGHAYHGEQIFGESLLNARYTMPVAETASIMAETIVMNNTLKATENKLPLIEAQLQDGLQIIVDIYSRYLFEESVFNLRETEVLNENKLCDLMRDAQMRTYGDGMDPEFMHPYMWIPKGHYYSGGLSFYNFPYSFGLLIAKGLYAQYVAEGEAFVPKFRDFLRVTGQMTVEEAAATIGITLDKKFWSESLKVITDQVEEFLELT